MVRGDFMKNPLNRRLIRELKDEFGKYFVIFIFVCGMIAIVSGFLVASDSMITAYNNSFEEKNIEDGNFELVLEASDELIAQLEDDSLSVYKNYYVDEKTENIDSTLRIFKSRNEVNRICVMSGVMPSAADEIAIDRMYADNNSLSVNDTIIINGKSLKVTALVALSDYSALYSSPSDMMFDAMKFGVAVMTEDGFNAFDDTNLHYSYSWKYNNPPADNTEAKEMSENFLKILAEKSAKDTNTVLSFIPEFTNQAIIFAGDDLTSDNMMFTVFLYIVMIIISFVFAIMTGNTITKEANVIGTLRASGYSKSELVRHYLAMPTIVILISALVGNVLGYTVFKDYMAEMYYGTYSLPTYTTIWNADAFVKTTVIPVIIMFVINLIMLVNKLSLSPLKFIRRDLNKRQKKKAFHLNTKIGIMHRFRLRVIFQNIPNYITIFIGVFLANAILLFGIALNPLLEHYQNEITSNMICDYQYLLKAPVETSTEGAEKICVTSLETLIDGRSSENTSIYGISSDSAYIDIDFNEGVYISNAYSEQFNINKDDIIVLKEKYGDKKYSFKVDGVYYYPSSVAVFMNTVDFNKTFENEAEYFNGYFSEREITDIDKQYITTTITQNDLTKTSRQLIHSMGNIMTLFIGFGVIMFLLIIYLLSKIIIEKNAQSISMTKILGYKTWEISSLYVISTAIVVVVSMIVTIPLCNVIMSFIIPAAMSGYSGWLPYYVPIEVFAEMAALGIVSYALIAALQFWKIGKMPKDSALKNAE